MDETLPMIHQFSTYNNEYIYDVNTNTIIKIDNCRAELLREFCSGKIKQSQDGIYNDSVLSKLKENGYLSNNRIVTMVHPEDEILEFHLNSNLNLLILQVTQQCNLRCKYCPYSGGFYNREHSNKKMSLSTAKKAIDFYINHSTDSDVLSVGFYGGEPVLEMELIKQCIEYTEEKVEGRKVYFNMTSNGTMLTLDVVRYMKEHNVDLMISLDGPKEVHDKNRDFIGEEGSFTKVISNLEMIKEKFPDYFKTISFNCVMDPDNDFGCINEFFTNYDTIKDCDIRFSGMNTEHSKKEIKINDEEYRNEYKYEMFKLFLSRIGRLDEKHVSKMVKGHYKELKSRLITERHKEQPKDKGHPGGPCVPGGQRLFVDIDGNFYPCERVNETSKVMRIGNVDEGFYIDKARNILNIGKITEEKCKDCWAYKYCYLCAFIADDFETLSPEKKLGKCNEVRQSISNFMREYCILKENGDNIEEVTFAEDFISGEVREV